MIETPRDQHYTYFGDFINVSVDIRYYDSEAGYVEITEPRRLEVPFPKVIAKGEFKTIAEGEALAIKLVSELEDEAARNAPDPLEYY